MYLIIFKVVSNSFFSKFSYMFGRVLIRISNKFIIYFVISVILAILIALFYYKYISRLLRIQELNILQMLKRVVMPIFRRKERKNIITTHYIFAKRQMEKIEKRKKMLDVFGGSKESAKEPEKKVDDSNQEDGYVMWPPRPKEEKKSQKVFDRLSRIK
ncbi:MAG: hypothetical protein V1859_03070 [archaeon]